MQRYDLLIIVGKNDSLKDLLSNIKRIKSPENKSYSLCPYFCSIHEVKNSNHRLPYAVLLI